MKILALDIGDVWTGTAISDPLCIIAKPYKTIPTWDLETTLTEIINREKIERIVVGHPKTLRGTSSEQTKKTEERADKLKETFPHVVWVLWDERLSSKHAAALKKPRSASEKQAEHSVAAAYILSSYLEFFRPTTQEPDEE